MTDAGARFVWAAADGRGRNQFVAFRRTFALAGPARAAVLHLFADSRYRLTVDGAVVGYGPARCAPAHPEYDTWDLADRLGPGAHELVVTVNHYGASSFQTLPGTVGGFVAWGAAAGHDLATPGDWQARRLSAWDAAAPAFSFAQGPVEILDQRALAADDAGWSPAVPLADAGCWGSLTPCPLPAHSASVAPFAARVATATLADDEERLALRCWLPGFQRGVGEPQRFAYHVWLHSPRAQTVALGLFWGDHWLGGELLARRTDLRRGNRQEVSAALRAGWNLLYGEVEMLADVWGMLLGLPHAAGLLARARPDLAAPELIARTEALSDLRWREVRSKAPADAAQLDALDLAWHSFTRAELPPLPAREFAWDVVGTGDTGRRAEVFDFGGEYLGHLVVDWTAPAGTILDLAYDERRRADGLLELFATNPFVDSVDRYVSGGGRQTTEGFHVRGGRYVQATLRLPAGCADEEATIHGVGVRPATYPLAITGEFVCDEPLFEWVYQTAAATLVACSEDTYLDCPWRERGFYLGDASVEWRVHRALSADWRLPRRCLRLVAQCQRPDGALQGCTVSWLGDGLGDFGLLWVLWLADFWAWTGDVALVAEVWPALERFWASPRWQRDESGLCDAGERGVFLDWGAPAAARGGEANAALNALRYAALAACATLARARGLGDQAAAWQSEAELVRRAFQQRLWDPAEGWFAAALDGGAPRVADPLHANLLALAHGLPDATQTPQVLARVLERLERNVEVGLTRPPDTAWAELYFLHTALEALYRHDCDAAAEDLIRAHYEPLRAAGAWTLWECFSRGAVGVGSLCHAWSGGPAAAFAERVLGVGLAQPGVPNHLVIAPRAATLHRAQGQVPLAAGPVRVAWERQGNELRLEVSAPPGVSWEARPAGPLASCRVVVR